MPDPAVIVTSSPYRSREALIVILEMGSHDLHGGDGVVTSSRRVLPSTIPSGR
jgi:hypothetical protein